MTKNNIQLKHTVLIIGLITLAVAWRIVNFNFHIAPNLEIVTMVSVLAAITMGWRAALIVPLTTMMLSDIVIGNSSIFIFTWGSFLLIGLSALILKRFNHKPKLQILSSIGFAIVSSFLFFIITNFGVWTQGWYPMTFAGLMSSYIMAIPFYRTMLIGNLILVPSIVVAWQYVRLHQNTKQLVINPLVRK